MGIINTIMKPSLEQRHTRIHLYKTLARPVLCYGSEAWTLRKKDESRITANEMKFMRYRPTAEYTKWDHKRNKVVMEELQLEPVINHVKHYQNKWINHLHRMHRDRIPKVMLHYRPNGKRSLGRPKKRWIEKTLGLTHMEGDFMHGTIENTTKSTAQIGLRRDWTNLIRSIPKTSTLVGLLEQKYFLNLSSLPIYVDEKTNKTVHVIALLEAAGKPLYGYEQMEIFHDMQERFKSAPGSAGNKVRDKLEQVLLRNVRLRDLRHIPEKCVQFIAPDSSNAQENEPFWEGYITTLSDAKYSYMKIIGACKTRGFVISRKSILYEHNKTGKARMGSIPEWKKASKSTPVTSRRTPRGDTNSFHSSFTNLIKYTEDAFLGNKEPSLLQASYLFSLNCTWHSKGLLCTLPKRLDFLGNFCCDSPCTLAMRSLTTGLSLLATVQLSCDS
ncbi:hypothetical protein ANN_19532 [Periplaneta americana]|uniref:Uncharacterized protein n=1 Tax=Periplaneta americana TaxID=6978 RepID=A0ABQ8SAQ3_PERAM|nr:hypothetical protein ANN_19532 [Periplaneta americana]